jgi:hypothetical protein
LRFKLNEFRIINIKNKFIDKNIRNIKNSIILFIILEKTKKRWKKRSKIWKRHKKKPKKKKGKSAKNA